MPVLAAVALGGWVVVKPDSSSGGTGDQLPTERTVEVTQGDMARTVSAQGTVAAAQSKDLSFGTAGTVTAVNVKAGDQVTAGQVLAAIDATELESAVADAEASVAQAQATLSDHRSAGASSAQIAADRSSLTSAEDHLADAQADLAGAQLVAPFDATVASIDLTVGEELSSSGDGSTSPSGSDSGSGRDLTGNLGGGNGGNGDDGGGGSTADITLVSTGRYQVELGIDDSDIDSIQVDQAAKVTLSSASSSSSRAFPGGGAFPGLVIEGGPKGGAFSNGGPVEQSSGDGDATTRTPTAASDATTATGKVTEVSAVADASSGVASYPVTVAFDDDSGDFNVGATVQVDITISEVKDAIQVPAAAVTTVNGQATVTVSKDGKEETRDVTTGLTSDGMVQITSGLEAGEQVVIRFGARLSGAG
jgi:multidrug efflux pump subunit AcrA (membrane-fusion protein)